MKYHEGSRRGLIPHPATITWLCLKAGVKEILEHKEEKFRKEMEERDRDLLKKLKLNHEAFYNNQFNRDSQLLKLIKERDSEQETKIKQNIKGFKFLYMQLIKDFEKKMMDRDKVLDNNDAYRRKI